MMTKNALARFFLLVILLPLAGCATIVHGPRQDVSISTNPPGALVSDGKTSAETPTIFNLPRGSDHVLTITKPGYHVENIKLSHVISEVVAGNLIFGGLIGWGIDALTGAQWRLDPETVIVTLRPLGHGEIAENPKEVIKQPTEEKKDTPKS